MTEINEIDQLSQDLPKIIHNLDVFDNNQTKSQNPFYQNESKPNSKSDHSDYFSQTTESSSILEKEHYSSEDIIDYGLLFDEIKPELPRPNTFESQLSSLSFLEHQSNP